MPSPQDQPELALSLALTCPECGAKGRVEFGRLSRIIRCHACNCLFAVGRDGREHSRKEVAHVEATCPRCREPFEVAEDLLRHSPRCPGCGFSIEPRRKAAAGEPRRSRAGSPADPSWAWPRTVGWLVGGGLLLLIVACAVVDASAGVDPQLKQAASQLLAAAIQGKSAAAAPLVPERQQADYRQWTRLHLRDALGAGALQGNAKVDIALERREGDLTWLLVTVRGASEQEIQMKQAWRQDAQGAWKFDPKSTSRRARIEGGGRRRRHRGR